MRDFNDLLVGRRPLIQGALSLCAASLLPHCKKTIAWRSSLGSPNVRVGHAAMPDLTPELYPDILDAAILGGGVSGLSCARELTRQRVSDFRIFELESIPGGNSRSGTFEDKTYPLGAHYLPMPNAEQVDLLEFLREAGVVTGYGSDGTPKFDDRYVLQAPAERLFQWGRWHHSMVPSWGNTDSDRAQFEAFWKLLAQIDIETKGEEFVLPIRKSRGALWSTLDHQTMAGFLLSKGLDSKPLHWYVDYCCRDDFGSGVDQASAWAGIHYFLARRSREEEKHTVLTWPEGNWFLARALINSISSEKILSGSSVVAVEKGDLIKITVLHHAQQRLVMYRARSAVVALPTHVRRKLGLETHEVQHAPWVTATLALRELPFESSAPMSWDNVSYHSKSLGYIRHDHQALTMPKPPYLITYYSALVGDPFVERSLAALQTSEDWGHRILADLRPMHNDIDDLVTDMRIWVWPHAMVKPLRGVISRARKTHAESWPLLSAHTDDSGMSLFEEAFDQGQEAARFVTRKLHSLVSAHRGRP